MSMIFPGMDPYLESSRLWPGVHSSLIVYMRDQLQPRLRPRYVAAIEERVFVETPDREREVRPVVSIRRPLPRRESGGVAVALDEADAPVEVWSPPEPIHESYVTILDLTAGQRVVTVIEVVSPTNKYAGAGRDSYLAKQADVLSSEAHLVEIDLLRYGPHVLAVPEAAARAKGYYDYLVCVNRAEGLRERYELYPRRVRDRLPRIRVPLSDPDPDVVLDVEAVIAQTYDAGRYRDRIDYAQPCDPPLIPEDRLWVESIVREAVTPGRDARGPEPS